ncbi:terpene synthase 02 [Hibiscus trionum]|uniref:Terpene synthase 02 n=1 Tax=Hibiscus trionum TaxID=183268 RepID=A0A9W7M9M8_HIBTR|nr:terpene synthase 02 [Hibiscus trionum]
MSLRQDSDPVTNALISSGGIVISVHSMLSLGTHEMIDSLGKSEDLVYNISIITRLCNDLGTSAVEKERGDAPSLILCHMREMNASEKEAEEHIKNMISNTWMKINGQCLRSEPPNLLPCSLQLTLRAWCIASMNLAMDSAFKTDRPETISTLF